MTTSASEKPGNVKRVKLKSINAHILIYLLWRPMVTLKKGDLHFSHWYWAQSL